MLYFRVADLLDYLRETYSPESTVTYDRLFEEVRNAPLLALEDYRCSLLQRPGQERSYTRCWCIVTTPVFPLSSQATELDDKEGSRSHYLTP